MYDPSHCAWPSPLPHSEKKMYFVSVKDKTIILCTSVPADRVGVTTYNENQLAKAFRELVSRTYEREDKQLSKAFRELGSPSERKYEDIESIHICDSVNTYNARWHNSSPEANLAWAFLNPHIKSMKLMSPLFGVDLMNKAIESVMKSEGRQYTFNGLEELTFSNTDAGPGTHDFGAWLTRRFPNLRSLMFGRAKPGELSDIARAVCFGLTDGIIRYPGNLKHLSIGFNVISAIAPHANYYHDDESFEQFFIDMNKNDWRVDDGRKLDLQLKYLISGVGYEKLRRYHIRYRAISMKDYLLGDKQAWFIPQATFLHTLRMEEYVTSNMALHRATQTDTTIDFDIRVASCIDGYQEESQFETRWSFIQQYLLTTKSKSFGIDFSFFEDIEPMWEWIVHRSKPRKIRMGMSDIQSRLNPILVNKLKSDDPNYRTDLEPITIIVTDKRQDIRKVQDRLNALFIHSVGKHGRLGQLPDTTMGKGRPGGVQSFLTS